MVVMGVTSRYILKWILEDRRVTPGEYIMLTMLEYYNYAISSVQAGILVASALYIIPHLSDLTTDRQAKYLPNGQCDTEATYCDYDLIMFSLIYFGFCWLFIGLGGVSLLYVRCFSMDEEQAFRLALQRATEEAESDLEERPEKWMEGERLAKWAGQATEAAAEGKTVAETGRPSDERYEPRAKPFELEPPGELLGAVPLPPPGRRVRRQRGRRFG
jgi:hypothetical protein